MTYPAPEPTPDEVPDGTQLIVDSDDFPIEEGDAGVNDTGDEPWYKEEEDGDDG